jgi:hypothetical protein
MIGRAFSTTLKASASPMSMVMTTTIALHYLLLADQLETAPSVGVARKPGLIPNVTGARDATRRARKSDHFRVGRPKPQQQNEVESSLLRRAQAMS